MHCPVQVWTLVHMFTIWNSNTLSGAVFYSLVQLCTLCVQYICTVVVVHSSVQQAECNSSTVSTETQIAKCDALSTCSAACPPNLLEPVNNSTLDCVLAGVFPKSAPPTAMISFCLRDRGGIMELGGQGDMRRGEKRCGSRIT